jgi:hypothetical protein
MICAIPAITLQHLLHVDLDPICMVHQGHSSEIGEHQYKWEIYVYAYTM